MLLTDVVSAHDFAASQVVRLPSTLLCAGNLPPQAVLRISAQVHKCERRLQVKQEPSAAGGIPLKASLNGAAADTAADDDPDADIFAVDDDDDDKVKSNAAQDAGNAIPGEVAAGGGEDARAADDRQRVKEAQQFRKTNAGLNDMYDDAQGYYNFRVGEIMAGRCGSASALPAVSAICRGGSPAALLLSLARCAGGGCFCALDWCSAASHEGGAPRSRRPPAMLPLVHARTIRLVCLTCTFSALAAPPHYGASSCRYEIVKASGKGVFSSVVTAHDKLRQDASGGNPLVAIKMIRANNTMFKAGQQELAVLHQLADGDPGSRKHVIRLLRSFEYRNHLCMVRCPLALRGALACLVRVCVGLCSARLGREV